MLLPPQPKLVLILFTPNIWKADWLCRPSWLVTYLDGLPVRNRVTHLSTNRA